MYDESRVQSPARNAARLLARQFATRSRRAVAREGEERMLEQNKHIARQFIAAFAAADTRTLERIVAEHMVDHTPAPGAKQGRRGVVEAAEMFPI
jgi:hypothetical protein